MGRMSPASRPKAKDAPVNSFGQTFRDYGSGERLAMVTELYREKHSQMTVQFTKEQREHYLKCNTAKLTVWEALEKLNEVVDNSDPDVSVAQIEHAFQTAEALRAKYPGEEYGWLHLTGLIHDLGKILCHPDLGASPNWALVGDTYPVGCQFSEHIPFCQYFAESPDTQVPEFQTRLGMYEEGCGLRNTLMAWGHDEYMAGVLRHNKVQLPEEAYYIIQFHSFYAWHTAHDYDFLCDDTDREMKRWVKLFQECDLYSKVDEAFDKAAAESYYKGLIDKYIGLDTKLEF